MSCLVNSLNHSKVNLIPYSDVSYNNNNEIYRIQLIDCTELNGIFILLISLSVSTYGLFKMAETCGVWCYSN